jgi:hypothetical protein
MMINMITSAMSPMTSHALVLSPIACTLSITSAIAAIAPTSLPHNADGLGMMKWVRLLTRWKSMSEKRTSFVGHMSSGGSSRNNLL